MVMQCMAINITDQKRSTEIILFTDLFNYGKLYSFNLVDVYYKEVTKQLPQKNPKLEFEMPRKHWAAVTCSDLHWSHNGFYPLSWSTPASFTPLRHRHTSATIWDYVHKLTGKPTDFSSTAVEVWLCLFVFFWTESSNTLYHMTSHIVISCKHK